MPAESTSISISIVIVRLHSVIAGGDGPPLQPPLCLAGRAAEGRERAARRADRPASLPATRLAKQRAAGRGPRRRICARKRQGAHYGRAPGQQNGARKGTRAHLRAAELRRPRPACLSAGWGYPRGCSAAPSHRFPRRCLPFSPFQPQRASSSSKQPLSSLLPPLPLPAAGADRSDQLSRQIHAHWSWATPATKSESPRSARFGWIRHCIAAAAASRRRSVLGQRKHG